MRDRAIRNTHSTVVTVCEGDSPEAYDQAGNAVDLDESAVTTELARLDAEYIALEYARARKRDYPTWGEQLNKIYDDGVTKWKAEMIDPVKTKWPKNNSGPVE